jgi:probable O-glycosylation ligase (exosortase A-associated)
MAIRDLIMIGLVGASLPIAVVRPYVGVLVWTWLGFMNPHRLTWGVAWDLPFAQVVAVATLLGLLFTRDRARIPWMTEPVLLGAFWVLTALSTVLAVYPEHAWIAFQQFSKILLMMFVTIVLCQDRQKFRLLLLVAAISIGFYGFKGGIFGIATGGAHMVMGPERSFIGDNNGLGLALNMTLPLLFFMAREEPRRWLRLGLRATFCLSIISVLLTYSRGNFLGLVVVLSMLLMKTRWKLLAVPAALVSVVVLTAFLPDKWFDRMHTITEWEQDGSAMGRIYAWRIAFAIALEHPIFGGGFGVFQRETWARYMPEYHNWHDPHSIYFHVLAEHGFTGLGIFLAIMAATLISLRALRRRSATGGDSSWVVNYSYMLEMSIIAYVVSGAFQNLTYFDLYWFVIGAAVILKQLARGVADPVPAAAKAHSTPRPPVLVWSPPR